jgi:F-type H+-transporting ATPase subunit a
MGEEQVLSVTKWVNWLLGKPALYLYSAVHVQPANRSYPISNFFAMELVVFAFAIIFFLWLKRRLSADKPGATQQCMELFITNPMGMGVKDLVDDIIGHGGEKHIPLMGTVGMFILLCNLLALIPGFMSPTAEITVPLACAVVVFLYYNWHGIRHHGPLGYGKTLMGPVLVISPLMALIETISHFARMLSLTVRLWANMLVSELIYVTFLGLTMALFAFAAHWSPVGYVTGIAPVGIPLALDLFHVFEAILQAFIFTILAVIYVGLAVAEEH